MNSRKINEAIQKYSPHGLCSDVLLNKDNISCVIGCLILDTFNSLSKKELLKFDNTTSNVNKIKSSFIKNNVLNNKVIPKDSYNTNLLKTIKDRFNINEYDINILMSYNDAIYFNTTFNEVFDDDQFSKNYFATIPRSIRRLVYNLRKKYNNKNK